MPKALIAFVIFVALEIYATITVAGFVGGLPCLGLLILSAIAGIFIVNLHSRSLNADVASCLRGKVSAMDLTRDKILFFIAGFLLIFPGFFSDILALLLFLPPVRAWCGALTGKFVNAHTVQSVSYGGQRFDDQPQDAATFDCEATEVHTEEVNDKENSGR